MLNSLAEEIITENKLAKIYINYLLERVIKCNDTNTLRNYKIAITPECMLYQGYVARRINPMHYKYPSIINGKQINYSIDTKGSYINSYTIKIIEKLKLKNVNKVIWIENKTNYIHYILNKQKSDEFVIYHGGMYSQTKGCFFKKLYLAIEKNVQCYHWSNIDIGGFKIFTRLKSEIVSKLKPYYMEKEDLEQMKKYWKPISEKYKSELEKMYIMDRYSNFKEVINFMIENKCKLEQESFILDKL